MRDGCGERVKEERQSTKPPNAELANTMPRYIESVLSRLPGFSANLFPLNSGDNQQVYGEDYKCNLWERLQTQDLQ